MYPRTQASKHRLCACHMRRTLPDDGLSTASTALRPSSSFSGPCHPASVFAKAQTQTSSIHDADLADLLEEPPVAPRLPRALRRDAETNVSRCVLCVRRCAHHHRDLRSIACVFAWRALHSLPDSALVCPNVSPLFSWSRRSRSKGSVSAAPPSFSASRRHVSMDLTPPAVFK